MVLAKEVRSSNSWLLKPWCRNVKTNSSTTSGHGKGRYSKPQLAGLDSRRIFNYILHKGMICPSAALKPQSTQCWEAQQTNCQWSPVHQHLHSPHHSTVMPLFLVKILRRGKTRGISERPIAQMRYAAGECIDKPRMFLCLFTSIGERTIIGLIWSLYCTVQVHIMRISHFLTPME